MIFTSGGTESINLAILGLASETPGTILLTPGEHPATREACRQLESRGWRLAFLDIDSRRPDRRRAAGRPPLGRSETGHRDLAHNETGVIQDVGPLAARCKRFGIPLHLDAVQAVGKMPLNFRELDVTALSLAAHKFHGPAGIGALLLREGNELSPRQFGGHQESDRRAGTETGRTRRRHGRGARALAP